MTVRTQNGAESPVRTRSGLKLSAKLPLFMAVGTVLACLAVAYADYRVAAVAMEQAAADRLVALLDARRVAIVDYLASIRRDLKLQSKNPFIIDSFQAFLSGWRALGPGAAGQLRRDYIEANPYPEAGRKQLDRAAAHSAYSEAHNRYHPRLREFTELNGYRDLFFIDARGRVIYSVMKRNDFAVGLEDVPGGGEGLGRAFRQAMMSRPSHTVETFVDFSRYEMAGGRATAFIARPVVDRDGARLGILVFEMPVSRIDRVMSVSAGLGRTGEIFLAGSDLLMRNNSRHSFASTILEKKVDPTPVKLALAGRSGVAASGAQDGSGDVGKAMLWAYAPLDFLGARWAIVAQIEASELQAAAAELKKRAILHAIGLGLLVAVLGYLATAFLVVRPLAGIAVALGARQQGGGGVEIPAQDRSDEIGDIARGLARLRGDRAERDRRSAQHEQEAKIEEVQRRLAEAIEAISDGFILLDPDDRVVLVNSKYRELYGRSAHLLTPGADFRTFLRHHAELGEIVEAQGRVDEFMADRMERMKPGDTVESRLANGRWLLVSDFATEDGGTVSVCSDITDLKRREHALVDSEERYRLLVDTLPDGVMLHDADGIRFMNAVGRELLEIPEDQVIDNLHYRDFVQESERAAAEERIRMTLKDGIEIPLAERRILTFRGKAKVFEIAAVPFRRGGTDYGLAVFRDITDRKMTEQRLRESEGQVRAIVDAAADAIVMLDKDERIVDFNPAAEHIFGHRRDEMIGRQMSGALVAPAHRADFKRSLRDVAEGSAGAAGRRREIEGMRLDGMVFPVEMTVTRVTVEGRELFAAFLRDLTEARQAQAEIERQREALHQSEKLTALGSLLAGVAHELNNPLSVVVAQTVLMEETARDEKVVRRAREIRSAAERCARIVKTFLSMARQQKPEQGVVRVNDLIGNGLELLGYALRTAGVEVIRSLDPDLPNVWGDADQLHQVVANLIVNAQQAMMDAPEPRTLTVTSGVDPSNGMIFVTFDDTGPGVPQELRTRIFDPFYTTKPTGIGTGIGLSVCHGVVESHGGRIHVEDAPGGGARFRMLLPTTAGVHEQPAAPVPDAAPPPDGHRILVVDDEPEIASSLAEILELDGHSVDVAGSGEAALERIANAEYDLIVTDLRMPKLDGQGLYARLQAEYPQLCNRVIVVTGDTLHVAASDFLQETGLPMLEKPFIPSDVSRLVSEMLERGDGS